MASGALSLMTPGAVAEPGPSAAVLIGTVSLATMPAAGVAGGVVLATVLVRWHAATPNDAAAARLNQPRRTLGFTACQK
jgi:hypothetical protein